LARTSDIDSTEKLLNVIRGQDQGLPGRRDKEKTPPSRKKRKIFQAFTSSKAPRTRNATQLESILGRASSV